MIHNKTIFILAAVVAHLASVTLFTSSSPAADALVSIGDGSGAPGSKSNKVTVFVENTSPIKGLELIISDQGNYLSCSGCQAADRASDFTCYANEHRFGYTKIQFFSSGGILEVGSGPVLILSYGVKENAPSGECIALTMPDAKTAAASENKKRLSLKSLPGEFCITGGGEDETSTTPATTTAGGGTTSIQNSSPTSVPESGSDTPSRSDGGAIVPPMSGSGVNIPQAREALDQEPSATRSASRRSSTATSIRAQTPRATEQAASLQDAGAANAARTSSPFQLLISPSVAKLYSGDMMQFAVKTLREGNEIEGRYAWQFMPPSTIGSTISETGEFTAGNNPNDTPVVESIYVTDMLNGNSTEIALITIEKLDRSQDDCSLRITPSSATVQPGKSVIFAAHAIGASCKEGSLAWRINSTIGSRIDENGRYTAGDNPSGHSALDIILVKDSVNSLSADAIITVVASGPDSNARMGTDQAPHFAGRYFNFFAVITVLAAVLGIALAWKFKR